LKFKRRRDQLSAQTAVTRNDKPQRPVHTLTDSDAFSRLNLNILPFPPLTDRQGSPIKPLPILFSCDF
jgi:hypothetical protein